MLSKEILNDITIDELRNVCRKWHEVNDICNATPDGYNQFDITQECDGYTDRYIDGATYSMWITTDHESGKTWFSDGIILYDEGYEIAETNIDEIEEFIKYVDGDTPQRVKDIIAEARATYEEIMKLN